MATTPPSITAAPTPPDRADRATFSARATASFDHLKNNAIPEISAVATNVYNNAVDAFDQAALAADQVALAAAQAISANDSAAAAANSAQAAASSAGAVAWVSGATYALGEVVWSPITYLSYRRALAGAGATDPSADLVNWAALASGVTLTGNLSPYVTQVSTLTITNYDSATAYTVSATGGTVSRTNETITYTAGATAGAYALTVNGRNVPITVQAASVAAPTITGPNTGATDVTETPTITTTAFAAIGLADTHLNSDWELWTGPSRTGTKIASSYNDTVNKTSWPIGAGILSVNTTYYPAVLHRGTILGASAWAVSSFTTAATFNSYIATPTATPSNFGDALEGGFYAGMIWNQLVQSSSSKALATGTQTFTVPDMSATPIVYGGQTLEVRSRANPANKFVGTVTGAIGTTLTLNVSSIAGSGTFSDWSIMSRFRIIQAPKASGENAGVALKNANDAFPAACQTLTEGWLATEAMKIAGNSSVYPAAWWARGLSIGGKTDWYVPARDELELAWRNLKPTTGANYTAANRPTGQSFSYANNGSVGDTANTHGTNNNSSPVGAAYTSGSPAQTTVTSFQTGGAEAFEYGAAYYWSCSEYSATNAWLQNWRSSFPGFQDNYSKADTYRVRAVRRSII
ncbi:MAG: hypothetical protein PHV02_08610 [Rhodocyclaceae bacterium]|nr:hypothetical protein [Rhodocyclaceae bacterium]